MTSQKRILSSQYRMSHMMLLMNQKRRKKVLKVDTAVQLLRSYLLHKVKRVLRVKCLIYVLTVGLVQTIELGFGEDSDNDGQSDGEQSHL